MPAYFQKGEMDEETGLYYYGARYLDPKYSRWLSGDPALGDYIPKAPIDDEAKWSDIIKVQCQNCRKREEERQ